MPWGGGAVKVLGSLLLLLSGLLWGVAKSRELWRRERLLREWQRLLQNLQTSIRCWARPLGKLVEKEDSPFCRAAVERPCFSQDPRAALAQAGEELLTRTSRGKRSPGAAAAHGTVCRAGGAGIGGSPGRARQAGQAVRLPGAFWGPYSLPAAVIAGKGRSRNVEVDLIFKIAAIGIIVAVLNQLLIRSGREEQAMMTTLAGLIVVLMMIINEINALFQAVKAIFDL